MGISYVSLEESGATEPVALEDLKKYMRLPEGFDDDDSLIEDIIIPAARRGVERFLNRTLIEHDWEAYLDAFPIPSERPIRLSKGPVTEIAKIEYQVNGELIELEDGAYFQRPGTGLCEVCPSYNHSWPTADCVVGAVKISFTAGYGAAAEDVPEDIRLGIMLTASHLYNNRNIVTFGQTPVEVPYTGKFLLRPYRIDRL